MTAKSLTIKDVLVTEIQHFHALRKKNGKTPAGQFSDFLKNINNPSSNQLPNDFEEKLNAITAENSKLNTENANLIEINASLLSQNNKNEASLTELEERVKNITIDYQELLKQIQQNSDVKLDPNQFIVTITGIMPEILQKVKAQFYKDGFTKNTDQSDYHNQIAKYAIRYFLENEYKRFLPY
jgi:hypothetical protein